jgi:hypothetical protein
MLYDIPAWPAKGLKKDPNKCRSMQVRGLRSSLANFNKVPTQNARQKDQPLGFDTRHNDAPGTPPSATDAHVADMDCTSSTLLLLN